MDKILDFIKSILNNNGQGWTIGKIIKTAALIIVALFALSVVLAMFKWVFGISGNGYHYNNSMGLRQVFSEPEMLLDYADEMMVVGFDGGFGGEVVASSGSAKMVAPQMMGMMAEDSMPYPSEPASKDAEDYETREYSASYEKSNIDKTCEKFEDLKPLEYVVFSNANKSDSYCSYTFKVEVDKEDEIILLIESLDPKSFDANTFTLERSITNNINEIEILKKKIKMLDSLLASAQTKYTALRNTGDTGALVQAINNEINLIERITNQKLTVQSRIDRLTNNTGVQTERIDYSQFNIFVAEKKFIDMRSIGESWRFAFERFVSSVSGSVQDLTMGLMMFVFTLVKFVLYLGIGVMTLAVATRLLWKMVRKVWRV
ncbi:MAG: hypothetical protein LRZ97_02025 [Candidatus Pacebacteria bacterium]|nr:hypothetical protein [Candidatus Paceibacterota bacterium]